MQQKCIGCIEIYVQNLNVSILRSQSRPLQIPFPVPRITTGDAVTGGDLGQLADLDATERDEDSTAGALSKRET